MSDSPITYICAECMNRYGICHAHMKDCPRLAGRTIRGTVKANVPLGK